MDKRLIYRVIIKLLALLAVLVLAVVFINSLFTTTNKGRDAHQTVTTRIVELNLSGMNKGEVRKTHWNGKEVAILYRKGSPVFYHTKYIAKIPHPSLNSGLRSLKVEYFVYINHGDSNNCPLFNELNGFKDICTSTKFDTSGRVKANEKQGFHLKIPPHYFEGVKLIVGVWSAG